MLQKKTSQPRIKAETLDSGEAVKEIVHHQGLFYVSDIIRIELTSHFGIKKSSRTCCEERTPDLQLLPNCQ